MNRAYLQSCVGGGPKSSCSLLLNNFVYAQTPLAVLCLCLAARANDRTASIWSDDATPSESTATCRGRFGSLPVARFTLRSCAMCYVYLGNATHSRRLLPVPGHYEALARVDANYTMTRVRFVMCCDCVKTSPLCCRGCITTSVDWGKAENWVTSSPLAERSSRSLFI